jgi:hypothetical protein
MKFISRLLSLSFLLLLSTLLFAQEKTGLGSTMRSSGRIYVVIAVIVTILIGLFIYLIRLDRKIGKLEKNS